MAGTWLLALGMLWPQPAAANEICVNGKNPDFFRERALEFENRIAFKNPRDGALNFPTGLCWWHSRFQRSLFYLATARPLRKNEKPMSKREIDNVIAKVISESQVVELRGYKSIFEFTQVNEAAIHSQMKWWQAREALNGLRGLMGKPVVSAQKMEKLMHELYDAVENKKFVAYQMLQYPGITAHSWLVTRVLPVYENLQWVGYELWTIDSNYPGLTMKFQYRRGQTHFAGDFGQFTPYLQWQSSRKRYISAAYHYCKPAQARAQLIANLEKAGDQIVWREEEKEITAKEFAHRLRQPGIAIPGDIARKFTFTDPQLAEFDRLAASNDGGTDRKPARQEQ